MQSHSRSFSLVDGPPTRHVRLALPVTAETVDGLRRAATAAGHRDHGAPGERGPVQPGYVPDVDGDDLDVANQNR